MSQSPSPNDATRGGAPRHPDVGIIALPIDVWGPHWTSRHQVLTRLAEHFHVLWLNPAREWRDVIRRPRVPPEAPPPEGIPSFVVRDPSPWHPVVYRPAWLGDRLARARLAAARAALLRRGCTRIVLYLWHPDMAPALGQLSYDLSCYHIYDEYSHAEVEQPLDPREVQLIRSVDQLFVASKKVLERKGSLNPHSLWVSNGVEYAAFSTPHPEPEDLAGIPHPRIGYAGFIKKQLDWPLLLDLATRHPEWSWVFVGAQRPHPEIAPLLERMRALSNVHFLGAKPTHVLARYPQHFDVCIMPYRVDDYTKYIYPLKLHEYLASGRPTVGTRLPVLEDAEGLVALARTLDEWERGIAEALSPAASAPERVAARQARAREHDWSRITATIAATIAERLHEGAAERPGRMQHRSA
ncbi:MAG: glycosyltransferase [Gemmatimonadaceae bacterium]|nr:glycosyltransferase [Gemmatimonadaceae bacterium]